jgi:hypothetical protein
MRVTVERTFNLGNYENIRFGYEVEVASKKDFDIEAADLARRCHLAYDIYIAKHPELKERPEEKKPWKR